MAKQVIVVRSDLRNKSGQKLRKGKIAAQVAHASMKVFFDRGITSMEDGQFFMKIFLTDEMFSWAKGIFTKICAKVDSKEGLLEIHKKAVEANLPCSLIEDAGKTEFEEPTVTCCAIGPASEEDIDAITGHLDLL